MRIQSKHSAADRGLDAYWTPPEAVAALLAIEGGRIPKWIWEPAAGNGAIVKPLRKAGFKVSASDIADYGLRPCARGVDYLTAGPRPGIDGIITNPPYRLAVDFARKATKEAPYVALLLRTNFLEGAKRLQFFRARPPNRIWISSRRLPMMHREGWTGPRSSSNTCHAWFVWDGEYGWPSAVHWFDWKERVRPPAPR